jgi:hypothetical protein
VTASLCSHFGSVHCSAMRPRTLPPCATR